MRRPMQERDQLAVAEARAVRLARLALVPAPARVPPTASPADTGDAGSVQSGEWAAAGRTELDRSGAFRTARG